MAFDDRGRAEERRVDSDELFSDEAWGDEARDPPREPARSGEHLGSGLGDDLMQRVNDRDADAADGDDVDDVDDLDDLDAEEDAEEVDDTDEFDDAEEADEIEDAVDDDEGGDLSVFDSLVPKKSKAPAPVAAQRPVASRPPAPPSLPPPPLVSAAPPPPVAAPRVAAPPPLAAPSAPPPLATNSSLPPLGAPPPHGLGAVAAGGKLPPPPTLSSAPLPPPPKAGASLPPPPLPPPLSTPLPAAERGVLPPPPVVSSVPQPGSTSSGGAWRPEDSLSGRPSGPLPPPPKPPDFGSLAPRLGSATADTSDWGEEEDATGEQGDAPVRRPGSASEVGLSEAEFGAPRRKGSLAWFAIAAVVLVSAVGLFLLWPRSGRLIVNVTGPGGIEVSDLKILVDGELACQSSPCTIAQLKADTHRLRIMAPGYQQPGERMVVVPSGGDATVDISLVTGGSSAEAVAGEGGTGLAVPALGKYLRVKVDGVERGELPLRLTDLAPGEYEIEIAGNDRYAPFKERITLEAGKILEYRPQLTVTKGLARVEAGQNAAGARVTLDCPNEGESLLDPPTSVDVDAGAACVLRAAKEGFAIFETPVTFADGDAEKTFRIELEPATAGPVAAAGRGAARPAAGTAAKSAGQCRISVNSTPSSNAVVGGRPVGKTPASVSVPCGRQVVMFIHPEKGRKSVTVQATPGKVAVASVRF